MELVECVGGFTPTKEQLEKVAAFVSSQPAGALLGVNLYPNLDCTSDDDLPSGMVAYFAPSAKVDATCVSDNLFQVFAVSKILPNEEGETFKEEYFESKVKAIQGAIDQFPDKPISAAVRNKKSGHEVATWAPELGGQGSFAGVYSKLREDHRTKDYFIAARGTAPLYVQDLKREIGEKAPTYRDLLYSEEWSKALNYGVFVSRRNICRNIANVAAAAEVAVLRMDDISSMLEDPNHAHPEMAVPDWEQNTYSIRSATFDKKPAVQVCYGVVPAEDCLRLEDRNFFVVSNIFDGVSVFKLDDHEKMEAVRAIPADTGRKMAPEKVAKIAKPADFNGRTKGVTWEGQPLGACAALPELHVNAFNPIGPEFKSAMKASGWDAERPVERLVPIAMKSYNGALRRK